MTDAMETPEFPKVLVKVRYGAGGYEAEIRVAADADAVTAATEEGFIEVEVPRAPFPPYPKWVYRADGDRRVVQNEAELEKLGEGWEDTPPADEDAEPAPEPYGTPAS